MLSYQSARDMIRAAHHSVKSMRGSVKLMT